MTFVKGGPCYKYNKVWTTELDNLLLDMIGNRNYKEMARRLGKSVEAIRKRAKRLGHRLDQGTITLRELARQTGYDRRQFRRAGKKLNQHWRRAAGGRKLLIKQDQADELITYLRKESSRDV